MNESIRSSPQNSSNNTMNNATAQDNKKNVSFPMKLFEMLDECETNGWNHVVSWEMNGSAFKVHKTDEFVAHVMARYFNQTKYKSFQRQLNLYGFSRVTRGPDKGCYVHENFSRHDKIQCAGITRKKVSDDEGVDLTPTWLPASLAVEPDPIDENKHSSATSTPAAPGRSMMDAFESYFQSNVVGSQSNSGDSGDLKKMKPSSSTSKPPENALQRMLDSFLDPNASAESKDKDSKEEETGRKKYQRAAVFPDKLHDMLDYVEKEGLEHVASWEMEGRAFKVHKIDAFMKQVMPLFFKQSKYESLQRQLNLYGFTRVPKGPAKGCYHHPLFLKGGRSLSSGMVRRRHDDDIIVTPTTTSSSSKATAHIKALERQNRQQQQQQKKVVRPQMIPSQEPSPRSAHVSSPAAAILDDDDSLWGPAPIACGSSSSGNDNNMSFPLSGFGDSSPIAATIPASSMEQDFFGSMNSNNNNNMFAAQPWAQPTPILSSSLSSNNNGNNNMFAAVPWSQPSSKDSGDQFPFGFVPAVTNFTM